MDFRDNGTLVLRAETNEFDKKMGELNNQAKTLKATLKDIETQSGRNNDEYKKTKTELDNVRKAQEQLTKEMKNMDMSKMTFQQLTNYVKALNKEVKATVPGSAEAAAALKKLGEAEAQLKKVTEQAKQIKTEATGLGQSGLWSKITSGIGGIGTAFQAIMALQVIQWIIGIGKEIFTTTASFEKYEAVLTTALGSQKEARQSMEAIKKMAKETGFGVDELTEGYIKMVNRGLRPSQKEMVALADLAADQGKTFDQLVEAVLDAQTGEFERLKEFGIRAKKEGDNVTLSFKGQTQTVKNNEEAIYQAMIAMGSMTGVAGQNAKMMETLGGKASNFSDVMDSLKVAIGDRLSPIFKFFLDLLGSGIEWLARIVNASDPVIQVFSDVFDGVGKMASAFLNIFSNIFPSFNAGGNTLNYVMQGIAIAFRAVLLPTQAFIGILTVAYDAIAGLVQGGKAVVQVLQGDFAGAAQSFENSKKNFTNVGTHAAESFDKIKKGWTDAFVNQPKKDIPEAVFAAKTAEEGRQNTVSETQRKAAEKRAADQQKAESKLNEMIAQLDAEHNQITADNAIKTEEYKIQEKKRKRLKEIDDSIADEKIKETARALVNRNADAEILALREKDNKKALEVLSTLESEHVVKTAKTALDAEEAKILEIKRKRIADIEASAADEKIKTQLINAINRNAEASLDKVREDYRLKRIKEEEEAAKKRLETEEFIRDKERTAEMSMLDWREVQAKGNATKIAAIHKERVEVELRLTQQKLQVEMEAEQQKAIALTHDAQQLATALQAIDDQYNTTNLLATQKAKDEILAIDKETHEKKAANLKAYSDMFGSLLKGDVSAFLDAAGTMVKGHQDAWQKRLSADMGSYEQGAQMAHQAVSFLNDLAQKKAQNAIDAAMKERDEKLAVLNNELSVTESLIKSSSDYVTALKEAEKTRLTELQQTLTSDTATEEEKRDAMKKYYSEQLQQMKAAEEAKITELQKLANQAKTDDEKAAIEAKIALARQESEEKIRLGEEEMNREMAENSKLIELQQTLSSETTSEEQKRAAVSEAYSIMLQNLKTAEEAKLTDLHKQANAAKTADEKAAIEAKIALAEKERDEKIRLMTEERDKKTATLQELDELTKELSEQQLADAEQSSEKQILIASDEAEQKADFKADLEDTIAAENRKARATEMTEKKKAFAAQKKADIATALITGALAVLKALANFFPLNIILAATAAVVTGVQIAKIKNQPEPTFAHGGFVAQGGKHGNEYGKGGIALVDRGSGREVGEMEGDEAIISADQTAANWPVIQQMFKNARTAGMRNTPVMKLPSMGPSPLAFRDGGKFESPYWEKGMYLFGSKKRAAEQAAKDAEAEAAKAQAEADAAMGDYSADTSGFDGIDATDPASTGDTESAKAAHAAAEKQGAEQLKAIQDILLETKANGQTLSRMASGIGELKQAVNGVEGAVRNVEGAVNSANTNGKFDQLIGAISSMAA